MKNSDFDKHIQKNASSPLTAPDHLDWDNMDIVIPKKKSRKSLVLLTLIGFVSVTSGLFYWNSIQSNTTNHSILNHDEMIAEVATDTEDKVETKQNTLEKKADIKETNALTTTNILPEKSINNDNQLANQSEQLEIATPDNSISYQTKKMVNQFSTVDSKARLAEKTGNSIPVNEEQNIGKSKEEQTIQKLESSTNTLELSTPLATLGYQELETRFNDLAEVSTFSTKRKRGNWSVFMRTNYTQNSFQSSNSEYLNLLKEADTGAWSQSYSLSKSFDLSPQLLGIVGISYHRLHTVFAYQKYLGYYDRLNAEGELERVNSIRNVYHNNYSNIAELNLGLGKNLDITNQLAIQFQIAVNPGYKISETGKTFDAELDIVSKDFTNANKWTLSTSAGVNISYDLQHFKLLAGAGISKYLTNTSFDNETITNRPSLFFINAGVSINL